MVETARSADGTKIAYERTGDGPVLILVGGALNNRHSADALVPHLAEKFSVVAFDRRGRGDSTDTPPYAPAREVEDLKALIDAVGGSAMVFGHSSGAVLSLEAAADGAAITRLAVNEPPYLTGNAETGSATAAGDRGCPRRRRPGHGGGDLHPRYRRPVRPGDEDATLVRRPGSGGPHHSLRPRPGR